MKGELKDGIPRLNRNLEELDTAMAALTIRNHIRVTCQNGETSTKLRSSIYQRYKNIALKCTDKQVIITLKEK